MNHRLFKAFDHFEYMHIWPRTELVTNTFDKAVLSIGAAGLSGIISMAVTTCRRPVSLIAGIGRSQKASGCRINGGGYDMGYKDPAPQQVPRIHGL